MTWITMFRVSKKNEKELLGICEGFASVDDTFTYEARGHERPFVVIYSGDEKQAFRRGMSIKRKLVIHGKTPNFFKLKEVDS